MFTKQSGAVIYGMQLGSAQKMLDFDFLCWREPSVIAIIDEGKKQTLHKLFYGSNEILITSYPDFDSISRTHQKKIDTLVNFASFRSATNANILAIKSWLFKNIIIIAEWIPERETREIISLNQQYNINIIWPATVGAMEAGAFRAWNTWGSLENIVVSKLYQTGSVGLVSKSGWMSNECRRVIADRTDGTSLSIALWWDQYNVMQFCDAMNIMQQRNDIKMIVMLWEVWGRDELEVARMIENNEITKPVIAWCIGTIGEKISWEVQFGHAWAKSNKLEETASYKNTALLKAWAYVPKSYMDLWDTIREVFVALPYPKEWNSVRENNDSIDINYKLEQIHNRRRTLFTSTISDEKWEELQYNKKNISNYTDSGSFANVIGNLWLKRDLPDYGLEFINTILILLADHGPAVSGATNAMITARAWNDLKSSLIAGLTTIWPKFGWAIDGAAIYFWQALEDGITANAFIIAMKKSGINIPGIWHKVKSKFNPDKRCEILLEIAEKFPNKKHLKFALAVEQITLEKRCNLILNVDGMIAVMLLDLFDDLWMSRDEIRDYIDAGIFNAFFILARTVWFIWHIIDQKRLKEPLYRTPWDDILYE